MHVIKDEGSRPIKAWVGLREDTLNKAHEDGHTARFNSRINAAGDTVMVDVPDIEAAALTQLKNLARLPFIASNGVAVMPDVHAGKGSTIGSVIATEKAIIPSAVGVDIGCVDADTEYLSPTGWKRIADYDGGEIMQYDEKTGDATFVVPTAFIRKPATEFYWLKTKYGINQMLSPDHRVMYCATSRTKGHGDLKVTTAQDVFEKHESRVQGFSGRFITNFNPVVQRKITLTDDEVRVMVMVCADGAFDAKSPNSRRCVLQFMKTRKVRRAEKLLKIAGIEWRRDDIEDERGHVYRLIFQAPVRGKSLDMFWGADKSLLEKIAEEVLLWDGSLALAAYFTKDKASADFVQYAFSSCGRRGSIIVDDRSGELHYRVFANKNTRIGIKSDPKTPIRKIEASSQEQFCFQVPTSFWIMRRGNCIVTTGNCGMNAVRLTLRADQLPDSLARIRDAIEKAVPVGNGSHTTDLDARQESFYKSKMAPIPAGVGRALGHVESIGRKSASQLGTLGSGNHFIELCLDEEDRVWIMLHSGSRGVGNMIGTYFIEKAKKRMEQYFIMLPDGDLAYLPEDTDDFNDYMEAVGWAQNYALENRREMMKVVIDAVISEVGCWGGGAAVSEEAINCHHNYVERENHFGRNMWVTRKGAIRARQGDLGIIPGSMGQKSYIVRGKGNIESYCSCSHGAGRAMSRTEARRRFNLTDLVNQTNGVECRKDDAVLDEIPTAYKDLDLVMKNQENLIEVVHTLRAVLCVKGS